MVKWFCFSLLALVQFNSVCAQVPSRIQKLFTSCYDPKTEVNQTFPRFDGYYMECKHPYSDVEYIPGRGEKVVQRDSSFSNIMFFPDGVCMRTEFNVKRNPFYVEHFKRLENNPIAHEDYFYQTEDWGVYYISGDTLTMYTTNRQPRFNPYWAVLEIRYKILSDSNWLLIDFKGNGERTLSPSAMAQKRHLEFTQADIKLKSDTWLKKEKWFWCDPKEWEKWMKEKGYRY